MKRFALLIVVIFSVCTNFVSAQVRDIINEDFDSLSVAIPDGWNNADNSLSNPMYNWQYYAPGYGGEGKCLRFNSYTSRSGEVSKLKTISFALNTEQVLRFKFRNPTGGDLSVYLSVDGGATNGNLLESGLQAHEWTEREYSLAAFTGNQNCCIVFQSTSNAGSGDAFHYLDDVMVVDIPLCCHPQNLAALSVSERSALLSWNLSGIGGIAEQYRLFVYNAHSHETDTIVFDADELIYEIENLEPNHTYELTLQAYCGVGRGYSILSEPMTVTTMCEKLPLPWECNFNSTATQLPECWTPDRNSRNAAEVQNKTFFGPSGRALCLSATTSNGALVATPIINHPANDLDLSMKLYAPKGTVFLVGVMTEPSMPETFEVLWRDTVGVDNAWFDYRRPSITSLGYGASDRVAFAFALDAGVVATLYVDDIVIADAPECMYLYDLKFLVSDDESISIDWREYESADAYEVEITDVNGNVTFQQSPNKPLTVANLSPDAQYTLRVRSVCGAAKGEWSDSIVAHTMCTPRTPVFVEVFDNGGIPQCWTSKQTKGSSNTGKYNFFDNGWHTSKSKSHSADYALLARRSYAGIRTTLASQALDIDRPGKYDLRLWFYRESITVGSDSIIVWVNNRPDLVGATCLDTLCNNTKYADPVDATDWYKYEYNIPLGGTTYIILEAISSYVKNMYVDDVEVFLAPTCRKIKNITLQSVSTHSATIAWQKAVEESQWIVDYTVDGRHVIDTVENLSCELNGLTPATQYTAQGTVRAYCGGTDMGEAVDFVFSFMTQCEPVSQFPLIEGFEGDLFPPKCWSQYQIASPDVLDSSAIGWGRNSLLDTYVHKGKASAQLYNKPDGYRHILVSPQLNLDGAGYRLSYWHYRNSASPIRQKEGLRIWINDSPSTEGARELLYIKSNKMMEPTEDVLGYYKYRADIYESGLKYIIFEGISEYGTATFIDDIEIKPIPQCDEVRQFGVVDLLHNQATLMAYDEGVTNWEVAIRNVADANQSTDDNMLQINGEWFSVVASGNRVDGSLLIENLSPSATYKVYARRVCGEARGEWSETSVMFTTLCQPTVVNRTTEWVEGFEDYPLNASILGCYIQSYDKVSNRDLVASDSYQEIDYMYDNVLYTILPYAGSRFAVTSEYNSDNWLFAYVDLVAGENYELSVLARHGNPTTTIGTKVSLALGSRPLVDSMTTYIASNVPVDGNWTEVIGAFEVPQDGHYFVGIHLENPDYYERAALDNIRLRVSNCVMPASMKLSRTTNNMAVINVVTLSDSIRIAVADTYFNPVSDNANIYNQTVKVSGTEYAIGGLQPNKKYYFSVRGACGDYASDWMRVDSFETRCLPVALPLLESFEGGPSDNFDCWSIIGSGSGEVANSTKYAGNAAYRANGVTLISPELDVESLSNYMLSGWTYALGRNVSFAVGVMTDPNNLESFEPVTTVNIHNRTQWTQFFAFFSHLDDDDFAEVRNARYVAIVVPNDVDFYFDDLRIEPSVVCPNVSEPTISNITSSSVEVSWVVNGSERQWRVQAFSSDGALAVDTIAKCSDATSPTSFNCLIPNLQPSQYYDFYVTALCSDVDASVASYAGGVRTLCREVMPLPYAEGLEGAEYVGDLCFSYINNRAEYPSVSLDKALFVMGGKQALELTMSATEPLCVVMPTFELPTNRLRIAFDYQNETADVRWNTNLVLGLIDDVDDITTFDTLQVLPMRADSTRVYYYFDSIAESKNNARIAFLYGPGPINNRSCAIDNILIDEIPACIEPAKEIEIISISDSSAEFKINSHGTTTVEYKLQPAGEGVNSSLLTPHSSLLTPNSTLIIPDLSPRTYYNLYIRSVCSEEKKSDWVGPFAFRTDCLDGVPTPWIETFEDYSDIAEGCFKTIGADKDSNPAAVATNESTNILLASNRYANRGEKGMLLSLAQYRSLYVVLPRFDAPLSDLKLFFDYYSEEHDGVTADLILGVMTDINDVLTFKQINAYGTTNGFVTVRESFESLSAEYDNAHLVFKWCNFREEWAAGPTYYAYCALDNIKVESKAACFAPENISIESITDTSASFVWSQIEDVQNFEYRLTNANTGENSQHATLNAQLSMLNLSPSTNYTLSLRTICSDTLYSDWVDFDFRTLPAPPALPYSVDFDDSEADNWTLVNGAQTNKLVVGSDSAAVLSGNKALYVSHNDSNYFYYFSFASDVHAYRPIMLEAGNYICEFDWRCAGEDTRDYGRLYLAPVTQKIEPGKPIAAQAYVPEGCVAIDGGIHLNEQPNWKHQVVEFYIEQPTFYNLVVSWHNNDADGATPPFAIDNIVVREATCLPVGNLRIEAIDDVSATIAWDNQNDSCQNYEYTVVRTDNNELITPNASLLTPNASLLVPNLSPSVSYTFAIRAVCGENDMSQWREITFTTEKAAVAAPYATGFESKADNDDWTILDWGNNKFIVGPTDEAVNSGDSALYVHSTQDSYAVSYNYVRNASYTYETQYIYAYRLVDFAPGAYYIDYDWKSEGKENEDFARVFLVPTSVPVVPGKPLDESLLIPLDRGAMYGSTAWGRQGGVLIANDSAKYKLVVAWQNEVDGSFYTGSLPVAIDNINISRLDCNVVDSIALVELGNTEASVEFVNLNGDGTVKYYLSKSNNYADAITSGSTTDSNVTLSSLDANTTYHLFLQAVCNEAESPMRELVFTTTKYQYQVPFSANFESDDDNARWAFVHGFGSNKFVINNDPQAVSRGEMALYVSDGDSAYKYVDYTRNVMAYASLSFAEVGEYVVNYDYKVKGESSGDYARIFLAPTTSFLAEGTKYPFDNLRSDFIALDGGRGLCSDTAIWRNQTVVFDVTKAGNYNLVVSWHNDQYINGTPPIAIDNIILRRNSCKAIDELIIHDMADVTATVVVPYEHQAQLYEYRVSLDTDVENAFVSGTTVGDTIRLNNLRPNTTQYLFVRAKCSDADYSLWKITEISTYCDDIISVTKTQPYIDNFEYSDIDPCWIISQAPRSSGKISMLSSLETMVFKATNDVNVRLVRPFYLQAGRRYELSIKSRQRELLEDARVGFVAGYKGGYDTLAQHQVTQGYEYYDATFTPMQSGVYELGVWVFTPWWCNNSTTYLLTIDEFEVKEVLLAKPENFDVDYLSSKEVDLSWTGDGLADAHQVQLLINGDVVADTIVSSTTIHFGNLKNSTLYDARVRGLLTLAGDSSSWATLSFRTHCDVVALPFRQDFESSGNNIPDCWTTASTLDDETRDWSVTENSNGNKMATVITSLANGYAVLHSPLLFVDSDIYSLSFRYNLNIGNDEYLVVRISADAGYSFSDTILFASKSTAWTEVEHSLAQYAGKTIMVEFKVRSLLDNSYMQQVNVDDVKIVCRSATEVVFTDNICWGNRYRKYGFDVETSKLNFGLNRIEMLRESQLEGECDTLKVLNLNIDPSGIFYLNDTICPGDVYNKGAFAGYNLTETGTYLSEPLVSSCGCDSTVRLYLVVQAKRHVVNDTICEGEVYDFAGKQITQTGIYVDTISYCEFSTLNLVVHPKYFEHADTICDNTYLEWEGMQLNKSGRYERAYRNRFGCDSIEVMNLWVIPEQVSLDVTICQGTTYYFGGKEISAPGTYRDSLVNILGCDSIVTLRLSVSKPNHTRFDDYVCQGYEYVGYGFRVFGITGDTLLQRTTSNLQGCDSIIEVFVDFQPTYVIDTTVVIAHGDVYEFGEQTLTKAGTYREVFVSSVGCDSIVNLTLEVGTGIDIVYASQLVIVPNPIHAGQTFHLNFNSQLSIINSRVEIFNAIGQRVYAVEPTQYPIVIEAIPTRGVYLVRLTMPDGSIYQSKLVVE